ncbi:uncharacterized protein BO95DRAFT_268091 [Aspergillus brunneoviolaceus CBS 621.78]|uniref:Uncharacterized protein n=1 Tax=Aspergillus brunneoviolaceus CBS 621.78 TaxID=1450534 RepID=A0ACD1FWR9_9EURO|nr:hypothetical protein BO95DRAFT_268091 [Aspergillus brunneoviolaceus CBS 621.78]RAH41457.1 hypothetical protein BO95DRAFT_268091 [Aspergillus brunneoviolaceus CBS 621.78]
MLPRFFLSFFLSFFLIILPSISLHDLGQYCTYIDEPGGSSEISTSGLRDWPWSKPPKDLRSQAQHSPFFFRRYQIPFFPFVEPHLIVPTVLPIPICCVPCHSQPHPVIITDPMIQCTVLYVSKFPQGPGMLLLFREMYKNPRDLVHNVGVDTDYPVT